jgi:diketogulonate reductase-like aldo/keto reductase
MTKLNNGLEMPIIGIGTWKISSQDAGKAISAALEAGYRHIDTAMIYRNEAAIGEALKAASVPRAEIFLTTKLWNDDHGYDAALRGFEASLERLDMEYVDLYLVHWPRGGQLKETWRAMEEIYGQGRAKAIGVSNYGVEDLRETMEDSSIVPAVNQIELHPFNLRQQQPIIDFCHDHDIAVEAYSPLTRGKHFDNPVLVKMSEKYGKSPAQILIRWDIQMNFITIPKSDNPAHIRANIDVFDFEISAEDMDAISNIR